MGYVGTVTNGVVVLPAEAGFEDGAVVRVEPVGASPAKQPIGQQLRALDGLAVGLPDDLAQNHDRYLHGKPKLPD